MKIYACPIITLAIMLSIPLNGSIYPSESCTTNNAVKKVCVLGTGYIGQVTGSSLANWHRVIDADIDEAKIKLLQQGIIPIYEPGLKEVVDRNVLAGRLSFTTDIPRTIQQSDIVFIGVGTPMCDDGSANLSYVQAAAEAIRDNLNSYKVIVIKSTVPVGTGPWVRSIIAGKPENAGLFDMVSNPEFLREGSAVHDVMEPDRIVMGSDSPRALKEMRELYQYYIDHNVPILETNIATSETIKYASNALLAIKISFINEMSQFTDATGADIHAVAKGMGLDKRINPYFLQPGPGFGGSCFPKDSSALAHMGDVNKVDMKLVKASLEVNHLQKQRVIQKLLTLVGDVKDKTVGLLGIAFKSNTDDIREAPALDIMKFLTDNNVHVQAFDPAAMPNAQKLFPTVDYKTSAYDAVTGADVVIMLTEWDEFKKLDLEKMGTLMKAKVMLDARNLFEPALLREHGFVFDNMGRSKI